MSGGIAYVYDIDGGFAKRCNTAMVSLQKLLTTTEQADDGTRHREEADETQLKRMLTDHAALTGSERAAAILSNWETARGKFIKVFPNEYRRALTEMAQKARSSKVAQKEIA